jgi:hypothetical protein
MLNQRLLTSDKIKDRCLYGFQGLILFGKKEHVKIFNQMLQKRNIDINSNLLGNTVKSSYTLIAQDSRGKYDLQEFETEDIHKKDIEATGGL